MSERRGLHVGVAIALAVAGVGLVAGVRGTGSEVEAHTARRPAMAPVAEGEARSYADLRARMTGPNAGLAARWWASLRDPELFAPVVQSEADRRAALARRAGRRAYDGAPPTVPHPTDQLDAPGCLHCHERGLEVAGLVAPRMSHAPMVSCVQCHVADEDPRRSAPGAPAHLTAAGPPVALPVMADNTFVGLEAPGSGERAWPGAPPTIPHSTWMRERCDSCHGLWGPKGVRSTHPWRQSCVQCHAPAAALDQRPVVSSLRPWSSGGPGAGAAADPAGGQP